MKPEITELLETKDLKLIEKVVQELNDINESVYVKDGNALNLLHFCAGIQDQLFADKCLQYLLSLPNIDVNSKANIDNIEGITAAHIAAQWGHENTLQILINSGSDLFLCDSYGHSVYDYAIDSMNKRCVELVDTAIKTSLRSESNWCLNGSHNNSSKHSFKAITYSSVSDKTLPNSKSDNNSKLCEDSERTETYFDENASQSTLISNVSYEKTDSIKSCGTDVTETYVYKDRDHDVLLIEERYKGSASLTKLNDSDVISISSATQDSDHKDVDQVIRLMRDTQLYDGLKAMGDSPGPITPTTRSVYEKKFDLMKKGIYSPNCEQKLPLKGYSTELNSLVMKTFPFDDALQLEQHLMSAYESDKSKNNYFTYLLLDPNITENLPLQANKQKIVFNSYAQFEMNLFKKFITSIFYVGKGQGNRAYEHFYEAIKLSNEKSTQLSPKINRILKIWSTDKGVISLHCFPSISSDEALTREALMIEALKLENLTNIANGQYKCNLKWTQWKKRLIGSYLLYKAFLILLLNGERQIKRPLF